MDSEEDEIKVKVEFMS